ncbi:MAG: cell division protein ZapA [Cypionkella sp.]|nr:cell division protein ZapA [Cypionkella sp.]
MSDLEITIGGRNFTVACQPGEEQFLMSAAAMLDAEAQPLVAQMGRLPESRMLLMAALMLADKTAAYEDELRQLRAGVAASPASAAQVETVQVIPPHVPEALAEIAARAEALAAQIEDMA